MAWIKQLCLICLLALAAAVFGSHPIDQTLEACIDENPSTHGMIQCISAATKQWEELAEKTLDRILKHIPPAELLHQSQKDFLSFQKAEHALIYAMRSQLEGTMYSIFAADQVLTVIRQRARTLLLIEAIAADTKNIELTIGDTRGRPDLEKRYRLVESILLESNKHYLQASREAWDEYRKSHTALLDALHQSRPGQFSAALISRMKNAFDQHRASRLESCYMPFSDEWQ